MLHLDLPEAPHRGYSSAAELFDGVRADDEPTADAVANLIRPLVADAERVYLPVGHGGHVDHLHVVRAADLVCEPAARRRWLDTPYVLRMDPAARAAGEAVDVSATLGRKLDACAAYATQLGFQFGGEAAMRRTLRDFAQESGGTAVERFVR